MTAIGIGFNGGDPKRESGVILTRCPILYSAHGMMTSISSWSRDDQHKTMACNGSNGASTQQSNVCRVSSQ